MSLIFLKISEHLFIILTIIFTVYSQLVMKWQVSLAGALPPTTTGRIDFIVSLLLNPWVITGVVSTFFAGVSWMLAMTKFEISYAFPFVSLNYIFMLMAGVLIFGETMSPLKLLGSFVVVIGLLILAKG